MLRCAYKGVSLGREQTSEREHDQLRRSARLGASLAVVIATATGAAVVAVPSQTAAASTPTVYGANRSVTALRGSAGFSTQRVPANRDESRSVSTAGLDTRPGWCPTPRPCASSSRARR